MNFNKKGNDVHKKGNDVHKKDNDDWGFYIDIDEEYSHNYIKKKSHVIIPDSSYYIDIYNFDEEKDYYDDYYDNYYDNYCNDYHNDYCNDYCNLYSNLYNYLDYCRNKLNTKKATNILIKVSSTTFATLALSYLLLAIL